MPATNPNQTVSGQSQPVDPRDVEMFARQLSADSIRSTTAAGSGHPTSCLSAAHIVATILLRHIRLRPEVPDDPANDRLLFSKGHAAPLLYAALAAVDALDRDMLTDLRDSGSPLEGHPVPGLPHVPIATGSLGQGLANGLGMALATRHLGSPAQIFVLLGDSEMAEGSVWEAMALASHYRTSNLTAIVDVNRLGQRGPTMYGWDTDVYVHRAQAFGWSTGVVDGHDPEEISRGLDEISKGEGPGMLVARTVKGHGVSFLEDQPGKHGKALSKEDAEKAIAELHPGEWRTITVQRPSQQSAGIEPAKPFDLPEFQEETATRDAFGSALATIGAADPGVVILDAEVSDSTRTAAAKESVPGLVLGRARSQRLSGRRGSFPHRA
ncbi:MAG: thiamine pyrophosphate-dependent enzyme [Actinomycetota bacterium]